MVRSSGIAVIFTQFRSLALGSRGLAVKDLQKLLNADPATRVAVSGLGSSGRETSVFGNLTAIAVGKFQKKYGIASEGQPGFRRLGPKTWAQLKLVFAGQPVPAQQPPSIQPPATPAPQTILQLRARLQALLEQLNALRQQQQTPP